MTMTHTDIETADTDIETIDTDTPPALADELAALAEDIRIEIKNSEVAYKWAEAASRTGFYHAYNAGERLTEAKRLVRERVGHGSWLMWLEQNGIPARTAQAHMELYALVTLMEDMRDKVADLSFNKALAALHDERGHRQVKSAMSLVDIEERLSNLVGGQQQCFRDARTLFPSDDGWNEWLGILGLKPEDIEYFVDNHFRSPHTKKYPPVQLLKWTDNSTQAALSRLRRSHEKQRRFRYEAMDSTETAESQEGEKRNTVAHFIE